MSQVQEILNQILKDVSELSEMLDESTLVSLLTVDRMRWNKMKVGTKKYGAWNPETCVRDLLPGDLSEELVDAMNYHAMQLAKVWAKHEGAPDVLGGTPENWTKAGLRAAPGHVPLRIRRGHRARSTSPESPRQFYVGDAGVDLVVLEDVWVMPGQYRDLSHDVYIDIPPGYWLEVRGCSSTNFRHRLQVAHGTIDNTYDGEIKTAVYNPGWIPRKVRRGDRISQVVLVPLIPPEIQTSDDGGDSWSVSDRPHETRGSKGFGSTR